MTQRTYDDWDWWAGAGERSAAEKEFDELPAQGQGALGETMEAWLRGETTRKEYELMEPGIHELKAHVGREQYRVLFAIQGRVCWVLTAFEKKTQRISNKDKKRARKRLKSL